jgi:hypothetical protein
VIESEIEQKGNEESEDNMLREEKVLRAARGRYRVIRRDNPVFTDGFTFQG